MANLYTPLFGRFFAGENDNNQWTEGQVPHFQTQPSCLSNGKQPLEAKKWKLSIQVFFGANYVIKPQPSTRMDMFEYSNYWFH